MALVPTQSLLKALGSEIIRLINDGFEAERNPYGVKWKKIRRAGRILQKSGIMRGSFKVRYLAKAVSVFASVNYASFHQFGTRNMVRREMVPARGLPRLWRRDLDGTVDEFLALQVANAR